MFLRDFALWIWLEKKDRNSGQGWASLGPSWLWVEFQPPGFIVRCWCYSQATFEEKIEKRVFGVVKGPWESHGARWNKSHCLFLYSIGSLDFYSWEQVHGGSQRRWWCPWHLMLLVITSLWTSPWVQSIFSLMITPGSPFLGRLTWLFAANSQLKHGMRSWWLTCRPSSKHGRKIGNGRVAIY